MSPGSIPSAKHLLSHRELAHLLRAFDSLCRKAIVCLMIALSWSASSRGHAELFRELEVRFGTSSPRYGCWKCPGIEGKCVHGVATKRVLIGSFHPLSGLC